MSVISILRDTPNNVSIVRMSVSDTLATVITSDYISRQMPTIRALNNGYWQWFATDSILVSASNGNQFLEFTDDTFSTLKVQTQNNSSTVTPVEIQDQAFTYAVDTGTNDNFVVAYNPPITALTDGLSLWFHATNSNTIAAPSITVDSLTPIEIMLNPGESPSTDLNYESISSGGFYNIVYDQSFAAFILTNPSLYNYLTSNYYTTAVEIQDQKSTYGIDTGTADNYVVAYNPVIASLTDGMSLWFKATNTNLTTSPVIDVGTGPIGLLTSYDSAANLVPGNIVNGQYYQIIYSSGDSGFIVVNPTLTDPVSPQDIQDQNFTFSVDTGSANNIVLTLGNAPLTTAYTDGLGVSFRAANDNSGATTITVDAQSTVGLVSNGGNALVGGEILGSGTYYAIFNDTYGEFVLVNSSLSSGGGVTAADIQNQSFTYAVDTGIADAYVVSYTPAVTILEDGALFSFLPANANATTTPTIAINGLSPVMIQLYTDSTLIPNTIRSDCPALIQYNTANGVFVLLNPALQPIIQNDVAGNIQYASWTYTQDAGSANAYSLGLFPALGSYNDGQQFTFKAFNANTGASTMSINGLAAKAIFTNNNVDIQAGDILPFADYIIVYNSRFNSFQGAFVLINPSTLTTATQIQNQAFTYTATDSGGSANTYVIALNPVVTVYVDGQNFMFQPANSSTGASTLDAGVGAVPLVRNGNIALTAGSVLAGGQYIVSYSGNYSSFIVHG